jgi:alkylhydroperoxidase family enzyme
VEHRGRSFRDRYGRLESGELVTTTWDGAEMFLNEPETDATVQAAYAANAKEAGHLMNYAHAWAWRQDATDAFFAARKLTAGSTTLSPSEVGVINTAVAGSRRDEACSLAWGTKLAEHTDPAVAANLLRGATDGLSEREAALAGWAAMVASDPNATSEADVSALRAAGLDDREIAEATMLAVFRLAFTSFNAALGVATDAELVAEAPQEVRQAVYSNVAS